MDTDARQSAERRVKDAKELRKRLVNGYFADECVEKTAKREVTTIPLRILGAALDEMQMANHASKPGVKAQATLVETVSDGERRRLEGSRLIFDTLVPTFPAIGFVGTVDQSAGCDVRG